MSLESSSSSLCHTHEKELDTACIEIYISPDASPIVQYDLFGQSAECQGCPLQSIFNNVKNGSVVKVDTRYGGFTKLSLLQNSNSSANATSVCDISRKFEYNGLYGLNSTSCQIEILKEPENAYLPIFYAFLALLLLQMAWNIFSSKIVQGRIAKWLVWTRRWQFDWHVGFYLNPSDNDDGSLITEGSQVDNSSVSTSGASSNQQSVNRESATKQNISTSRENKEETKRKRVKSLDAFRGLSITIMIFVNYGGGGYWFFAHSLWNGLTVADLVFPWFMWIMGVSLAISAYSKINKASSSRWELVKHVLKRSAILFFLGLVINSLGGNNDLRTLRIPGVLQRFAVCYCVVGLVEVLLIKRKNSNLPRAVQQPQTTEAMGQPVESTFIPYLIRDLPELKWHWLIMLSFLLIHSCVVFLMPVPDGCPTGYLGPGGLHEGGKYFNCTGGATGYVDIAIFGRNHIYSHPTSAKVYKSTQPFDPEGVLGSLTSIFLVFLGLLAGRILISFKEWKSRVQLWMAWGVILGVIAGALCGCSKEGGIVPVSKNLWSLSFSTALGSMAFLLLSAMYILIDVAEVWSGSPFFYPGMNSLLLYLGHEICSDFFPISWKPYTKGHAELLFMNLWGTAIWVTVSYVMYRKKIFFAL